MNLKKFTSVCLVNNTYSLFIYLLYCSEEDFEKTVFFFEGNIPDSICNQIKNRIMMLPVKGIFLMRLLKYAIRRIVLTLKYSALKGKNIFCLDCLGSFTMLFATEKYTMIPDCPKYFIVLSDYFHDYCQKQKNIPFYRKIICQLFFGKYTGTLWNQTGNCKKILVEENYPTSDIDTSLFEVLDLPKLWKGSSQAKKDRILKIFKVTNELVRKIEECSVLLLTEPFASDCLITEEELIFIYKDALKEYDITHLLIKPHPRDHVDYSKHFPIAGITDASAPMQLLEFLINKTIPTVITISSSAANSIKTDNLVWLGTEVHPNIYKKFGTKGGSPQRHKNINKA